MGKYILSGAAKQDLKDIKNYMMQFSKGAARRFLDAFEEKCKLLADFPELGRSRDELAPNLRSLPVDNQVIFSRPNKNGIQVERVLSGYRDFGNIFNNEDD